MVLSIPAVIGLGLNQWSAFIERGNEMQAQDAAMECFEYQAALLVIDGEAHCMRVHNGETLIAPLDWLYQNVPLEVEK